MLSTTKERSLGARVRLPALLVIATVLAACSGGGAGTQTTGGSFLPTSHSALSAAATTGGLQTSGTIQSMNAAGFLLQTGSPHGLIDIHVTSSTTITGAKPFAGELVSVSGTGSWATNISAATVAQGAVSDVDPFPAPSGLVSTSGTIDGTRTTGGWTLQQAYPSGKLPIYQGANATVINGPIATGSYVTITGTGSVHASVTGLLITVGTAAPSTVTAKGTIVGQTPYGFTLDVDSAHAAVPIALNKSVVIAGGVLAPGSQATVTGPGSISSAITPVQVVVVNPTPTPAPNQTPSPTPGPISQKHVLTSDYLGGYYGTSSIAWSAAAPYLNWASTNQADANAISAAGIKTMYYTNPNRILSTDPMYTSNESEYAHDCSGDRVTIAFNGNTEYVTNPEWSGLPALFASTIKGKIGSAHFDALFADNSGSLNGVQGISAMPCGYSDTAWIAGEASVFADAPAPIIFNGLSGFNGNGLSLTIPLTTDANDIGGTFEHCFSDDAQPEYGNWVWVNTENTQLQVTAGNRIFLCMAVNSGTASSSNAARMYTLASFLMTYDPAYSVLWESFATPSGFHVLPETAIVPLDPVVAQPSDVSALQISGGAYGREYRHCYIAGKFVGPCAIAVNPDEVLSHPFPFPQYTHTLVLNGNDVLEGGTIATNGPAAPTEMPPLGSAIVFP